MSLFGNKPSHRDLAERAARVSIQPLHDIWIEIEIDGKQQEFSIANISTSGIGILSNDQLKHQDKGKVLKARLKIFQNEFLVALKVAHHTSNILGCSYMATTAELKKSIEEYFKSEIAGLHFAAVNPEVLKADERGTPHWYRGKGGMELYFTENKDSIPFFSLTFLGIHLEGGTNKTTRFGFLVGHDAALNENDEGAKYKGSTLTQMSSTGFPPEFIDSALRLLEQVPNLPINQKEQLITMIKGVNT